jgi:hypothetical protein
MVLDDGLPSKRAMFRVGLMVSPASLGALGKLWFAPR